MGIQLGQISNNTPHYKTKKLYLYSNYILLGAATSCIFLTLSLRLIPSLCGFFFIALHLLTMLAALSGCHAAAQGGSRWFLTHMVTTVLTAIFQGSLSILIFTRTEDFLSKLKSYVMEENAAVILKMIGVLCVVMFVLEWVVLTVAFFLKYYSVVEGGSNGGHGGDNNGGGVKRSNKVASDEEMGYLPYPSASFHV
ncbi:uncharacterized protein LOC141655708 [Silene latifolia]|uniref:uncharacterized protein LOC141655708 n=1 Tax=Silene latifolia TaxID=37657 RepID=UPI003D773AAA